MTLGVSLGEPEVLGLPLCVRVDVTVPLAELLRVPVGLGDVLCVADTLGVVVSDDDPVVLGVWALLGDTVLLPVPLRDCDAVGLRVPDCVTVRV